MTTNPINYKEERENDLSQIRNSTLSRRVVVAGPGTGKSHLFSKLIEDKKKQGGKKFLAITFMGKLGDALADDLCGLAETMTMHGFARKFFLEQCGNGWIYYPDIYDIISEDLKNAGTTEFKIGDENYKAKTLQYKAVGDDDVVYYAVQICKKDESKIPIFDLVLVDEFQDFNEIESEFIDQLAKKNHIVIVGDDDQALYGFKGSNPKFIREKHDRNNSEWESHTLRFCSRCTDVIIKYFHSLVEKYNLNDPNESDVGKKRVKKQYICYMPEDQHDSKIHDSKLNPKICLLKNCPPGMMAYTISSKLEELSKAQKIKDALVIGETQSCKSTLNNIGKFLKDYGFKYVTCAEEQTVNIKYATLDAYKFVQQDPNSILGWRLLGNPSESDRKKHLNHARILGKILKNESVADSSIENLIKNIEDVQISGDDIKRNIFLKSIKSRFKTKPRPTSNFDITVCNILGSKGLGADVVFVVGFDQGRLPRTTSPQNSEVYQMLVALTRAKKRIYFINTVGKQVSKFIECLPSDLIEVEDMNS